MSHEHINLIIFFIAGLSLGIFLRALVRARSRRRRTYPVEPLNELTRVLTTEEMLRMPEKK